MGSCPLIDGYIQAGKASRGTNSRLYLPDGRRILRVQGTRCLCECLDHLPAPMAATQPNSVVTAGIFSVSGSSSDTVLDIEPSVFMTPVDQDGDDGSDPAFADPEFQAYLANAWGAFQADKKDKGKRVRFDGIQLPLCKTGRLDPRAASIAEEVDSPAIEALRSKSAVPPRVPGSSLPQFPTPSSSSTDTIPTRAEPFIPSSSVMTSGQFRYLFPLEDKTAPKHLLDRVLATTVTISLFFSCIACLMTRSRTGLTSHHPSRMPYA